MKTKFSSGYRVATAGPLHAPGPKRGLAAKSVPAKPQNREPMPHIYRGREPMTPDARARLEAWVRDKSAPSALPVPDASMAKIPQTPEDRLREAKATKERIEARMQAHDAAMQYHRETLTTEGRMAHALRLRDKYS